MTNLNFIYLMLAILELFEDSGLPDFLSFKKPGVKAVEKIAGVNYTAAQRDELYQLVSANIDHARKAAGYFSAHYKEKTEDVEALEAGASATLSHFYREGDAGNRVPREESMTDEVVADDPEDEPDADVPSNPVTGGYFVKAVKCTRRCRAGICVTPEGVHVDELSEEQLAALKADEYISVEKVAT